MQLSRTRRRWSGTYLSVHDSGSRERRCGNGEEYRHRMIGLLAKKLFYRMVEFTISHAANFGKIGRKLPRCHL